MKASPNKRLLDLLRSMSAPEAQNRLMRIADREIAIAMMFMEDPDRTRVLSLLASKKAHRIKEEFGFQKHLAVRYDQYLAAIENVIKQLQSDGSKAPLRSYLRPRDRRRTER